MSGKEIDNSEMAKWDPAFTKALIGTVTPFIKRWFRAEVRGLESFPRPVALCWCPTTPAGC
ncbi:hypothetical protein NIIDMKKI_79960 [Mycobacterium kansasii]|uniref:Uncharacterized protein n=1 Tax=Mycobacterium kansasii TaxID=1768 RepID=A0A7G1IPJ6_MYCKA|nr:hypothetical protein NIIDMKKI_79960 [Mycobacterium kansasii]